MLGIFFQNEGKKCLQTHWNIYTWNVRPNLSPPQLSIRQFIERQAMAGNPVDAGVPPAFALSIQAAAEDSVVNLPSLCVAAGRVWYRLCMSL